MQETTYSAQDQLFIMSLKPWWDYPGRTDPKYDIVPPPERLETTTAEQVLDENHLTAYSRALKKVLSTDLAETTFAQIFDGLPLYNVVLNLAHYELERKEPAYNHRTLCPGVLEKTRAFHAAFEPGRLDIRADVKKWSSCHPALQCSNFVL